MTARVLFVDDEPLLLEGIRRSLRKQFDINTAVGPGEGLRMIDSEAPYALVISDMRMPEMNGAVFLSHVRERSPESVRMILSGQSDLDATIAAVNDGRIFRFLTKPCPPDQLLFAVQQGCEQYRLLRAEKELLEETLSGSVKMLIEVLGLVSPASSSRAARLQRYVAASTATLQIAERWQWPLAALLSQIGCVALPKEVLSKVEAGQALSEHEKSLFDSHPAIAGRLLAAIPRLEDVAAIVAEQSAAIRGAESSRWREGDVRTVGCLLLKAAREFDRLISSGMVAKGAAERLQGAPYSVPADLAQALAAIPQSDKPWVVRQITIKDLAPGMILDQDLVSHKGLRIVPEGSEVTRTLIVKLTSIASGVGVAEPFRIRLQI